MYKIEVLIQNDLDDDEQAETSLCVGSIMEIIDESGLGIMGRILTVRIRVDAQTKEQ